MKGTICYLFCTWGNTDPYLSCTYEGYQPLFILFMWRIETLIYHVHMKGTNHCLSCTWGNIDPYLSCTYEGYQPLFILYMGKYRPLFIMYIWRVPTIVYPVHVENIDLFILYIWRVPTIVYPVYVENRDPYFPYIAYVEGMDKYLSHTCGGYRPSF